jgi:conjugal transfer pilus assembly protein TraB
MVIFKATRTPNAVPSSGSGTANPVGTITQNTQARRRQNLALYGGVAFVVLAGAYYVIDAGPKQAGSEAADTETKLSTDALVNRQSADRDWMAMYDHQQIEQANKLKGLDRTTAQMDDVRNELKDLRHENEQLKADATRVLDAYQRENEELRRQTGTTAATLPGRAPAASASAMGFAAPLPTGNEVKLVSFGVTPGSAPGPGPAGSAGDGKKIESGGKQAAVFTDSVNYLPPNSIAQARVVVGVDAATNVRSQSDPLPVLLRITGPARSVFADGKLLRTQVQGCMVNGAAYGDLSSEKVYVKLQRMTCPQPGGRFAVSEVKGFISFGGKVGLRGRVVSREGGLIGQAFLAGMAGGFGRGFSANANSLLSGTSVSVDGKQQQLSTSDILKGGVGEGVSQAGDTVSQYLIERAEQYQPVIEMPTGADVEVVFLDGTFIRN